MTRALLLTLALAACGDKDADSGPTSDGATDGVDGTSDGADGTSDGADGTDGTSDGADGTEDPITVSGLSVGECTEGGAPRLSANLAGAGTVAVVHESFEANCCADFTVGVSPSGATLAMVYTDTADPCDCLCTWDLSYTLESVPSGSYTITAGGGASADVTVP
jgi:hypothetical protein